MKIECGILTHIRTQQQNIPTDVVAPVLIDRNSTLYTREHSSLPPYVAYTSLFSRTLADGSVALSMTGLTHIDGSWLAPLAVDTHLVKLGEAVETPRPFYDRQKVRTVAVFRSEWRSVCKVTHKLIDYKSITTSHSSFRHRMKSHATSRQLTGASAPSTPTA